MVFTGYLVNFRVVSSGWAQDDIIYASVEERFQESGISPMDVVIVRNPPGYYVRTRRSAILLPRGDESTIQDRPGTQGSDDVGQLTRLEPSRSPSSVCRFNHAQHDLPSTDGPSRIRRGRPASRLLAPTATGTACNQLR